MEIERIEKGADASVKMTGHRPSEYALKLAREILEGKISKQEATYLIREYYCKRST